MTYYLGTGKLTAISVGMTAIALLGFSMSDSFLMLCLFFIGITVGRAINGFLTLKCNDNQLIRMGQMIVAAGIIAMLLPFGNVVSLAGFIIVGLGCAPIYPCVIHSTPDNFGADKSQAVIGVQMASAYVGNIIMPPLFGVIAEHITIRLLPVYLFGILILMLIMYKRMLIKCKNSREYVRIKDR